MVIAVILVAQIKKPSNLPFATFIQLFAITCRRAPGSLAFIRGSVGCISLFCHCYFSICIKLSIKTTIISTKHSKCVTIVKTVILGLLSVYFHSQKRHFRSGDIWARESKERLHGNVPAQRVISCSNPHSYIIGRLYNNLRASSLEG